MFVLNFLMKTGTERNESRVFKEKRDTEREGATERETDRQM